ncbi:MAG: replicative DNA helicase [Anaerolinea sp.]|nr:replicative DNA helicase [Anaerolinea sp.]
MFDLPEPINEPTPELQTIPHNREAEESLLGSILINPEVFNEIVQFLSGDDFYIHRNRWVWNAFTRLIENRRPIDMLTVTEDLAAQNQLMELGGPAYLTSLLSKVPSALNAESYARIIEDYAVRRRLLAAANDVAKLAYDQEKPLTAVIDGAEKSIFAISERQGRQDVQPIRKVLSTYFDHMDELARRSDEFFGVPTGLTDLDRLLGGLQKSDLLIIAGRPGTGKTGFLLGAARYAAMTYKKHVAIFSLEMSNEQLVQRLISQQTGIESQKLRSGKLSEDEWRQFAQAVGDLSNTTIFLDDTPAITPLQMRTKCRRLHLEHSLDLVIVDYLQLMSGDTRTDNRVQEVSYISRYLKVLAKELNVPVLAAAQLSRAVEQRADRRPMLSDLRESGSLEQDSDIVIFIHRPDLLDKNTEKQNVAELMVAKHRNGPTHSGIQVIFMPQLAKFENAATRH